MGPPDAYDECSKCGKFYYAHASQELSRRERHAFTPREAVPSDLDTLRAKLADADARITELEATLDRVVNCSGCQRCAALKGDA